MRNTLPLSPTITIFLRSTRVQEFQEFAPAFDHPEFSLKTKYACSFTEAAWSLKQYYLNNSKLTLPKVSTMLASSPAVSPLLSTL